MTQNNRPQSPIFVKTYDFLLWLLPLTLKFPKSQRFLLAEKLGKMALDFYEAIIDALKLRYAKFSDGWIFIKMQSWGKMVECLWDHCSMIYDAL